MTAKPTTILARQPINRRVLRALTPCIAGGVYFFGWRCIWLVVLAAVAGFLVEYAFTKRRGEPVSEAIFVTTTIFALIMPPTVPWYVVVIGVAFATFFAKMVFGGYGCNCFNPAMVGRCFVYVCFPVALTGVWAAPAQGPWGALRQWTTAAAPDAITGATPMAHLKSGRLTADPNEWESQNVTAARIPFEIGKDEQIAINRKTLYKALAMGRISGTMGVTSAILILVGGLYLFYTRTASRSIILSLVISYAALNQILYYFDVEPLQDALTGLLGGGFLFGAFFMATDPVSAPKTDAGKVIYGMIVAACTTVIRNFSIFNGGLMFSILIGNMFAPITDFWVLQYKRRGRPPEQSQ